MDEEMVSRKKNKNKSSGYSNEELDENVVEET